MESRRTHRACTSFQRSDEVVGVDVPDDVEQSKMLEDGEGGAGVRIGRRGGEPRVAEQLLHVVRGVGGVAPTAPVLDLVDDARVHDTERALNGIRSAAWIASMPQLIYEAERGQRLVYPEFAVPLLHHHK